MSISNLQSPLSAYGTLTGQLFLYGAGRAAFESPSPSAKESFDSKKCILIGGLSDGLLPCPYTAELEAICNQHKWSLVQPILSSSYTGFGHGSLQRDCDELQELIRFLSAHRNGREFCLVGHSTGCQDAVYFLRHAAPDLCSRLRVVVLQAPVSDREGAMLEDSYQKFLPVAQAMTREGKGEEMMPRAAFWAPITAQRYVDLHEKGGTDDYFSSDFSDDELALRLGHVGEHKNLKLLVAFSGADEFVPPHVDKVALTDRLVNAMNIKCPNDSPVALKLYLETATHNLSQALDDKQRFLAAVAKLLEHAS